MTQVVWAWIVAAVVAVAVFVNYVTPDHHWSMVYEAIQTPEAPGGQKRLVLFNEDGLTESECTALFDEKLHVLNNNAAVMSYDISCEYLETTGHGYLFQAQNNWLLPP